MPPAADNTPIPYLDCAATTPLEPRVREVVLRYLDVDFGNAGSTTHRYGTDARRAVERARTQVGAVVDATRGEVVFTSGATESNNLAILGLAEYGQSTGRTHIVSTAIEHRAVMEPLEVLAERGFSVTFVQPTAGGYVEPEAIARAVSDRTLLVSAMHVNNETGVLQPVAEIADLLADHSAYFHVDAAQGFGKHLPDLKHKRIDLISISGHKLYAPKGVGALIRRKRHGERPPLSPLTFGGGQETGLRPGTLAVPLIAGLGAASELAASESDQWTTRCTAFGDHLLKALAPLKPTLHGDPNRRLPHIVNLSFPGLSNELVIDATNHLAAISDGAACTASSKVCSHVLAAMGIGADEAAGALRFSWCHMTDEPDWPAFVEVVRQLRPTFTPGRVT
ncbi:aminotransferase class V-fold PLP-dependent enzyme [Planctomycetales bacterium ZRK34]|nr:aminotransferase class V-fold PLP-dependent enzyme [Planctomycetales bacterium ZRK34]